MTGTRTPWRSAVAGGTGDSFLNGTVGAAVGEAGWDLRLGPA